jgi:CubicO group peptidase (beta-lactamase class C family)
VTPGVALGAAGSLLGQQVPKLLAHECRGLGRPEGCRLAVSRDPHPGFALSHWRPRGWCGALVMIGPDRQLVVAYATNQLREPAYDDRGMQIAMTALTSV